MERFPEAGATTLAKKVFAEHKGLWPTFNACILAVRRAFGQQGNRNRRVIADKSGYRDARQAGADWFDDIPDGIVELKDWDLFRISGPCKALIINDVHIPFHEIEPLKIALRRGKRAGCNVVILNGDIIDCHDQSKFEKNPFMRTWPEEIRTLRLLLDGLRKEFGKNARIIYKWGNHEERYTHHMIRQCPVWLDIPEFEFEAVMKLADYGVELVREHRPIALGKLHVVHGHEYRLVSAVNAARGLFLRAKAHCLCGHLHQVSSHSEPNVEQTILSTWSVGCLCNIHPQYRPISGWSHGFAIVDVAADGGFEVENFKILKGKAFRA